MRSLANRIAVLAAALPALAAAGACPAAEATFTRKEVQGLSQQDLAQRVLAALAAKASAKERKVYISPMMPTPPWLETVQLDMPAAQDASLCRRDALFVHFAPLDAQAAQAHLFDAAYDPPTQVQDVSLTSRYAVPADEASCGALPDDAYFDAPDRTMAAQAVDAFALFRGASTDTSKGTAFACTDLPGEGGCKAGWQTDVVRFFEVLSLQNETLESGAVTRTIVLAPRKTGWDNQDELWLTVRFGQGGATLAKAQYVVQFPPPIP